MRYVIFELLKNACHASISSSPSKRELSPVLITLDSTEDQTTVCVIDQAGGVPIELQPHIFSYAFTSSGTQPSEMGRLTDCVTGCGVGLALSSTFARYMGGSLTMEVDNGVGSKFTLRVNHADSALENFPCVD